MFVLRALHSSAARLNGRKPNWKLLQPELERAAINSWRASMSPRCVHSARNNIHYYYYYYQHKM